MSDEYDNPKTQKMYQVSNTTNPLIVSIKCVTHLRTYMIGFISKVQTEELKVITDKLKAHGHASGLILEGGRLE